ncbi:c-type cytochrome [Horticoccus sp. 23ND18S-11]|uniref:c-type cytochrome n=1 Tax=Horticoccus sp. 23ND18S-11 TaxID=3391832 RepID=UPI0039C8E27A
MRFVFALQALSVIAFGQDPHQDISGRRAATTPLAAIALTPETVAAGRILFQRDCALCHGAQGEGGKGPTLAVPSLNRATDDAALLKVITGGVPGTEMPASRKTPEDIARLAAFVKSLGQLPVERLAGDPARGAQLYATKGACAQCHTLRGHGGAFGPDLTTIGRRRSAGYLRRALTDPAAEVPNSSTPYRSDVSLPENFLFVRAVTRDGRTLAGVRVNEDAFSLQLREASGRIHSVFKGELTALHKDRGVSPMPAYSGIFTPEELDDMVAYLASLRSTP